MIKKIILLNFLLILNINFFAVFAASTNVKTDKAIARILTYDKLLSNQGDLNFIQVKLRKNLHLPFYPNLKNQKIEFYLDGKKIGEAKTDKKRMGQLEVDPRDFSLGKNIVEVKGPYNSKATLNVFMHNSDTPILVTDIDHTISDLSSLKVPFTSVRNTPTLSGASKALNQLAQDFEIHYLTARYDIFTNKTKKWLKFNQFPEGAITFNQKSLFASQEFHKEESIRNLTRDFKKVLVGVGDKPHDVRAYRMFGLRAYFIANTCPSDLALGTICVKNWAEITEHINQNPL